MSGTDARRFHDGSVTVVAEEKVDGANLGFSLTKDYEVRCQNRAHFVTSASHAQWRSLDTWLEEHSWALCQLLEPEVEVLFGEWCALQHSVPYSRLPGPFIAFDIYNKRTRTFASVAERNRRLRGLGIPIVRQIARRRFHSAHELLALLDEHSAYGDGLVEGVYLRIDAPADEGGTTNCVRGKIVRPDFIQGCADGHWLSKEPIKNGIRPEQWDEPAEEEEAVEDVIS
jgi:atypical dual specificity phosphatase